MHRRVTFWLALAMALPLFMSACGGSKKMPSTSASISGNWQMSLQPNNANDKPKSQSGFLLQNGGEVTGGVMLVNTPCSGIGGVSGNINGSTVSITVSPTGTVVNLSGTIGADQASMSGDYTIISTGCTGSQTAPQSGTWTANLVAPLTGTIQGAITSNVHG